MRTKSWFIAVGAAAFVAACATYLPEQWTSTATLEAQGLVAEASGKLQQQRYKEAPFSGVKPDFSQYRTYAYNDNRPEPAISKASMPQGLVGDAAKGRKIFMDRNLGPCTGCHLIRGDDVWPAGNVGPDLSVQGELDRTDAEFYQMIHDMRAVLPQSIMPPWGASGVLKPQDIVDVIAFLKTQKGPIAQEKDPNRNPNTRAKPPGYGDNLDPTNNPAILVAEDMAAKLWNKKGTGGKSCADCHQGKSETAFKGVGTRYPRYIEQYGRMMSLEDYLASHGKDLAGIPLPNQSQENLGLSVFIKMQSNGMNLALDLESPASKAAYERGQISFNKRVGQRNSACVDCHTVGDGKGGGLYLGGRILVDIAGGQLLNHFPTWRTNFGVIWDPRKRFQWCMLPLGMNYLAADAVEYAELEFFVAAAGQGKPLSVPGIRH
jgi:sulfur-oxidizing protein SoxA